MLAECDLGQIPYTHIPPPPPDAIMEKVARKAEAQLKFGKQFIAPGEVRDYCPRLLKALPQGLLHCPIHAHSVAAWWSKASLYPTGRRYGESERKHVLQCLTDGLPEGEYFGHLSDQPLVLDV